MTLANCAHKIEAGQADLKVKDIVARRSKPAKNQRSTRVPILLEQGDTFTIDPHRNVFYYYKGQRRQTDEEFIYDPQIENNTTKAPRKCA